MTTKVKNPVQSIKLLVMLNSLLLLTVIFLAFFNPNKLTNNLPETKSSQTTVSADVQPVNAAVQTQSTEQTAANQSDELRGLPYVSRNGLEQQAAVKVVSYQRQPRVKARSSR